MRGLAIGAHGTGYGRRVRVDKQVCAVRETDPSFGGAPQGFQQLPQSCTVLKVQGQLSNSLPQEDVPTQAAVPHWALTHRALHHRQQQRRQWDGAPSVTKVVEQGGGEGAVAVPLASIQRDSAWRG